jgi:hypothetical protein
MNIIPLILFALQQAIKHVPGLAVDISAMLQNSKADPTAADWAALQAKYGGKTYEQMVPDSGLIPTPPQQ